MSSKRRKERAIEPEPLKSRRNAPPLGKRDFRRLTLSIYERNALGPLSRPRAPDVSIPIQMARLEETGGKVSATGESQIQK